VSDLPRVLAQDGDLWVNDKPSGFVVHRTADRSIPALVNWCRKEWDLPRSFHAVHRLDRPTSGVLLCSPDPAVRKTVAQWFADGAISKEYRALVYGCTESRFTVARPLMDTRRKRRLECTTHFRRVRAYRLLTYLSISPATGRKHQIRRHLRGIGHSIVGDQRYANRPIPPVPGFPGRLWLHAYRLTLPDGRAFEAPIPQALQEHLDLLDGIDGVAGDEPETKDEPRTDEHIRCADCGHTITSDAHRIEVNGALEHRFMNPSGYVFDIEVFRAADGCAHEGEPSSEFTWFKGYDWRYALCGECGLHLGWRFEAAGLDAFHGLIANRLA